MGSGVIPSWRVLYLLMIPVAFRMCFFYTYTEEEVFVLHTIIAFAKVTILSHCLQNAETQIPL